MLTSSGKGSPGGGSKIKAQKSSWLRKPGRLLDGPQVGPRNREGQLEKGRKLGSVVEGV